MVSAAPCGLVHMQGGRRECGDGSSPVPVCSAGTGQAIDVSGLRSENDAYVVHVRMPGTHNRTMAQ